MDWQRKVAVSLIATGAALCCVYAAPTMYGAAMSRLSVAAFRARSHANSLWDSSRVRAYQRTLAMRLPAPEAVLRIPSVGLEVPVLEGTSDVTLNRAIGHVTGTAEPGERGNIALTGHRDGFFRPLKDVHEGDTIELERVGHGADRYRVSKISIVFPSDTSVLNTTTGPTLTLITCYPFYYVGPAPQRYIVQAELVSPAIAPPATARAPQVLERASHTRFSAQIPGE